MNELEKCMAGEYYDCHDPVFLGFKGHARKLLKEYNALEYEQKEEKYNILKQLFGGIGANVTVGSPFICDYGRNIYIGDHVSVNMNCTFVDCNEITIGSNTDRIKRSALYGNASGRICRKIHPGPGFPIGKIPDLCTADQNRKRMLAGRRRHCPAGRNHRRRLRDWSRKRCYKGYPREFTGCRQSMPCDPENQRR